MTCPNIAMITTSHSRCFGTLWFHWCVFMMQVYRTISVEDENRHDMHDRRGSFVSDENCQIMAWNAGKSCVRYPRWWNIFERGGPQCIALRASMRGLWPRLLNSAIDLNFLSHPCISLAIECEGGNHEPENWHWQSSETADRQYTKIASKKRKSDLLRYFMPYRHKMVSSLFSP
jgi:hypothetical protein